MRKVIKAASNPTRDRAVDLQNFLIDQGVSEHDMLIEIFKKLSADDVVEYLEDIAREYDIPLEDDIESSTDIIASKRSKSAEDELRAELYTAENYEDELADTSRCKDLLAIDWNDVTAEDCETFLLDEDAFPVLKNIKSVRYFDGDEQKWAEDNGYDGGYVVTFSKPAGDVKYAAWNFGVDKFDDVSDEIAETFSKKINSATNVSDVNTSTVSFDFINDGDYDGNAIIDSVMDILRSYGTNPLGGSFEEVDYSGYPEYANEIVSQCNVDFEWEDDYDANAIEDEIGIALLPLEVIGVQFNAVGE